MHPKPCNLFVHHTPRTHGRVCCKVANTQTRHLSRMNRRNYRHGFDRQAYRRIHRPERVGPIDALGQVCRRRLRALKPSVINRNGVTGAKLQLERIVQFHERYRTIYRIYAASRNPMRTEYSNVSQPTPWYILPGSEGLSCWIKEEAQSAQHNHHLR